MNKFVINREFSSCREVEATSFATVGEFIDFFGVDDRGDGVVVLRLRAARVETVERVAS